MERSLAYNLRPQHISEVIGQKHILGKGKLLYNMINNNKVSSLILYGPPGTGKTSIANAIAGTVDMPFERINAVSSGKKDVEKIVENAKKVGKTILFIDEIHRFNKLQQDYLLEAVEDTLIILIGATPANPYHDVNPAIRSRCKILELKKLTPDDILEGLKRAINNKEKGLGNLNIKIEDEPLLHIAKSTGGDMRSALTSLELAVFGTLANENNEIIITMETVKECTQSSNLAFDKDGDLFYDTISSFQKSIRGSDVDASLHYLARLIEAGDLETICRRLLVIAYEDIGLANPDAGVRTLAAVQTAERVGFPEAKIPLSVAVVELALSPKSNSAYKAMELALTDLQTENIGEIPMHLRDTHYKSAALLGRVGYEYPHNYEMAWVNQQYLPDPLVNKSYYQPHYLGEYEPKLAKFYHWIKKQKNS